MPWKSKFCRGKVSFAVADVGHRTTSVFSDRILLTVLDMDVMYVHTMSPTGQTPILLINPKGLVQPVFLDMNSENYKSLKSNLQ